MSWNTIKYVINSSFKSPGNKSPQVIIHLRMQLRRFETITWKTCKKVLSIFSFIFSKISNTKIPKLGKRVKTRMNGKYIEMYSLNLNTKWVCITYFLYNKHITISNKKNLIYIFCWNKLLLSCSNSLPNGITSNL